MRTLIALLLLSSIGLMGCNPPISASNEPAEVEGDYLSEEPTEDTSASDSGLSPNPPSPESEVSETDPPDPLAAEPLEANGLKGKSKRPIWLFYYGYKGCTPCAVAKPKLASWVNSKGLTSSEADAKNAKLARVRYIDIQRDPVKRDLSFGDQPLYPTYLWVDQSGRELWHEVGVMDERKLSLIWDLLEK